MFAKDYETETYLTSGYMTRYPDASTPERPIVVQTEKMIAPTISESTLRRTAQPKILLYSHDTFGLGNIRRTLLLAENFRQRYPKSPILIITGSPVIHAFRLPEGIDYIKLPSLDRVDAEKYEPMFLADCADEIRHTRAAIIEKIALGFNPDLFIVDKRAAGINGELLTALRRLRRRNSDVKIVLGLRDILDSPERTSRVLRENGSFDVIDRFYDEVWIYGLREIFETAREYRFPVGIERKTVYCGYLQRPVSAAREREGRFRILVTTGGGGDGTRMIETYLSALATRGFGVPVETRIVFGPQMCDHDRTRLLEQFGHLSGTTFSDFEADLSHLYANSDLVISMAGYNTVCELLSNRSRAILIPRSEPVREQLIRATLLERMGIYAMIDPARLTVDSMAEKVAEAVANASEARPIPDLAGLSCINERVELLLEESKCVN